MRLLHIDSSIHGAASVSRALSAMVAARVAAAHPGCVTVYRDLDRDPVPYLSSAVMAAAAGETSDPASTGAVRDGATVLDDFLQCDVLLLGTPMYNFTISSQLKSWFDRIAVAGTTFRYSATGVEGLMGSKRAILVSTRGNVYAGASRYADFEHHERWLRTMLGFVGLVDVQVVRAEGLALSPQHREDALSTAKASIDALAV